MISWDPIKGIKTAAAAKESETSLQINFDRLADQLPADRADRDAVAGPEKRRQAVLADAEVAARKDHDALLLVLTHDAQLVLALALNLEL